jgi:hypothetical protein
MSAFSEISYAIDGRDRFVCVGGDWASFAEENEGQELASTEMGGRSLWDFIVDESTRKLYADLLAKVRAGLSAELEMRCDAPECRRRLGLRVSLLPSGDVEFKSVLRALEERPPQRFLATSTPRTDETLAMCSWCSRIPVGADRWLEVEDAMDCLQLRDEPALPRLESIVCPTCQARAR